MARPKSTGLSYFPHDCDASSDEKIEAMCILHGNDGYKFYFVLLERIYRTADFEISISDAETIQILSKKTNVTVEKFNSMLQTALKRRLFDPEAYTERGVLTSLGIRKRAMVVTNKREKMAESYQKKVSAAEIPPETPQSKVKKSKVYSTCKTADEPLTHSPEEVRQWEQFQEWVNINTPRINQMDEPLTIEQFLKLQTEYDNVFIKELLTSMDNHKPLLKKNTSTNKTFRNWAKRQHPITNTQTPPSSQPDAVQKSLYRTTPNFKTIYAEA